jgi:hypothetical protein
MSKTGNHFFPSNTFTDIDIKNKSASSFFDTKSHDNIGNSLENFGGRRNKKSDVFINLNNLTYSFF